jgi:hypothetical protein
MQRTIQTQKDCLSKFRQSFKNYRQRVSKERQELIKLRRLEKRLNSLLAARKENNNDTQT